ncbi:hypothetical protein HanRHA438_Chr04g0190651 [Helianthus annuus]|nr:hypothetical protein HanRHA438_Chr04g0190651 [Helianthus annuus]
MAGEGSSKKEIVNPKAIIHQRFGDKARYNIEEVQDNSSNGCPGLAIPQKGPCLYRCNLELPEFSIVSDVFKRKKDAMQFAAEKALEKIYSICHPLSGHIRAALHIAGSLNGFIPISVMPIFDSKISYLYKSIKPETAQNHWK